MIIHIFKASSPNAIKSGDFGRKKSPNLTTLPESHHILLLHLQMLTDLSKAVLILIRGFCAISAPGKQAEALRLIGTYFVVKRSPDAIAAELAKKL